MKRDGLEFKRNSFDLIRLIAALCIMFSHSCIHIIGDEVDKRFLFAGASLVVFFVLCGFFLLPSLNNNSNKNYIIKRIMRIYPVYLMSVLLMCLISGLISFCYYGEMLKIKDIIKFIIKMLIKPNGYDLAGISNGSVWAIFIELQIYVFALFFKRILLRINNKGIWGSILFIGVVLNLFHEMIIIGLQNIGFHIIALLYANSFIPYFYYFCIGIIVYKFFDEIVPILTKYVWISTIIFGLWHTTVKYFWVKISIWGYYTDPITVFTVAAMAIGWGYRLGEKRLNTDISYDIYIWHMIVVTTILACCEKRSIIVVLVACFITILISIISNYCIEVPISKFTKRIMKGS